MAWRSYASVALALLVAAAPVAAQTSFEGVLRGRLRLPSGPGQVTLYVAAEGLLADVTITPSQLFVGERREVFLFRADEPEQIYRIDPESDRIEVKKELTHGLLEGRQYGAIGEKLLLAAIPTGGTQGLHQFIVVDLTGGVPQSVPGVPDETAPLELRELWKAMYAEFGAVLPPEAPLSAVATHPVAARGQ